MHRTSDNKDEADGQSGGRLPSAADERSVDDECIEETGAAVKRVGAPDDSSDDDDVSSDAGVDLNPS